MIVSTVGWVVPEYKPGYLVLAESWYEQDGEVTLGSVTYIPDGMVVDIKSLGWVKP